MELPSRFNFKEVDEKWAKYWEEANLFHAQANPNKKPYTVVIPPPNVTGILHMGHALNNTLQDIIIRYKRMNGYEALWMPGTDHAGIATQNVVEKQLAKEGKKRHDLGRDAFLERLWSWKKDYGDTIIHQLKKLGASCDWPRTRFTMDEPYSDAVRRVFVKLYEKGLIYQGEYIINWCPRCQTALSDEEAEHQEKQGNLYHIQYSLKNNPTQGVIVATTRPETMLGDSAVAVNPKDERYKTLIGKTLILPLLNREIKIIADEFVDPSFGTGAVKVTPAHDPNDFEMGKRHHLEFINVMHPDGKMNEKAGAFNNLDRFKAREAIVNSLKENNLLIKIEPHTHAVGHCYRCNTVVEPYLSKQWFVKMKPLAKPALEAVKNGTIKFYPDRWTKVYTNWMEEIRDWCISRQIWWGHRIPVWYCVNKTLPACSQPIVSITTPQQCPHCKSAQLKQDEDVLDTWFSSWLWPFATLNWPNKNKDLDYFYPTSSLFTASEIIFFWVARMIMAGYEFMGEAPFTDVYIHGTVRDAQGRKMSKSLGNAIDPLEIINEYGADALRFSLIINSGQDLFISKDKFEIGRNFANKIWNASRLVLMNVPEIDFSFDLQQTLKSPKTDLSSRWIISQLYSTIEKVSSAIETYRYSEAENLIYEFFWNNFCDWYLEIIKDRWDDPTIQQIAIHTLKQSLKMIHPFMPFVTEEIWTYLKEKENKELCITAWPQVDSQFKNPDTEKAMQKIIDTITVVRNIRAQWNIKTNDKITCHFISMNRDDLLLLETNANLIKNLAKIDQALFITETSHQKNAATGIAGNIKCVVPLEGMIDIQKEKVRITNEINELTKASQNLAQRLQNPTFIERAPQDIVTKEQQRLASFENKIKEFQKVIANLE